MNRRWRRLLAGGIIGAAASMLLGRRRGSPAMERKLRRQVRPIFRSVLGLLTKEGLGQSLLFLRRRVK
ncbi:MAG: hypothetical protein GX073_06045 [Firmicutes bacterium]|nr:hypothetical protein [Bacillota bacterium]